MADARRMGKSELFAHFADRFEMKRTQAREFFDELTMLAEKELKRSGEFVLPGMVKLVVQKRKARMGRNPATGEAIKIPAKTVVKARDRQAAQGRGSSAQVGSDRDDRTAAAAREADRSVVGPRRPAVCTCAVPPPWRLAWAPVAALPAQSPRSRRASGRISSLSILCFSVLSGMPR